MIRTDRRVRICSTLLILNLIFIWGNSMLPGAVSGAFSDWVRQILSSLFGGGTSGIGGGVLRKIAHFTEFAALGALLCWRFSMERKSWIFPALTGAGAACVDETIQCFVPDRGPGLRDVMIDSCGVLTGILLLQIGHILWRRIKK